MPVLLHCVNTSGPDWFQMAVVGRASPSVLCIEYCSVRCQVGAFTRLDE